MKFIEILRADVDREPPPPPPTGTDPMDIRQLAGLLRCSIDTARRIPRHELPAYRIGKKLLFRLPEVLAYLHTKRCRDSDRDLTETKCEIANDKTVSLPWSNETPTFDARIRRLKSDKQ